MKNRYLALVLLLFFLLEGGLFPWLLPAPRPEGFALAPRLVLVGILYMSMFRHRHVGLACGLVFGFMQDIVYESPMLGVHALSMAAAAYTAGAAGGRVKSGLMLPFAIVSFGLAFSEMIVYLLYRLFQVIDLSFSDFVARQLAPTLLFNLLLAVLLYVPARKWLEPLPVKRDEESA